MKLGQKRGTITGSVLECRVCKKSFYVYFGRINTAKFCSYKCKSLSQVGKKRPLDVCERIGIGHRGIPAWSKGLTKETDVRLVKLAESTSKYRKGRPLPLSQRENMRAAHKKLKTWNWKGGISPENKKIRRSLEFKIWRESVFSRDNWTCQKCMVKGGNLHPHHIYNFSDHIELRFELTNGITLCKKCHNSFHKIYGLFCNNKTQLDKYIKNE